MFCRYHIQQLWTILCLFPLRTYSLQLYSLVLYTILLRLVQNVSQGNKNGFPAGNVLLWLYDISLKSPAVNFKYCIIGN